MGENMKDSGDTLIENYPIILNLGKDNAGNLRKLDLPHSGNCLVSYPKWYEGDSDILRSLTIHCIQHSKPTSLHFLINDMSGGLEIFNGLKHLITPVIVEYERAIAALQWISNETVKRDKIFTEHSVKDIQEFNKVAGFDAMYYILVVINGLDKIVEFAPSKVTDLISFINERAERSGIVLIASTNNPRLKVMSNFETKIKIRGTDEIGRIHYKPAGSDEYEKLQLDKVSIEETCKLIERLKLDN